MFENRVRKRIFVPKRNEVTGKWRKLHSEELHNLYSSPNNIRQFKARRLRWAGGEKSVQGFGGKVRRKRRLVRPRRRWEGGIRMDLGEIDCCMCVEWIQLAQDRGRWRAVVNAVMNLRVLAPVMEGSGRDVI
jgi:hypothetical protein